MKVGSKFVTNVGVIRLDRVAQGGFCFLGGSNGLLDVGSSSTNDIESVICVGCGFATWSVEFVLVGCCFATWYVEFV